MTSWPATLPSSPQINSLSGEPDDDVLKSKYDAGTPITRARYTAISDTYNFTLLMNIEQFQIFKTFYAENRALSFDFTDPVTGAIRSFKFRQKYTLNSIEAIDYYSINISIVSAAE